MPKRTDNQVLVVDDDADIRQVLREALEDAGYQVLEAPDGAVGLQLLARADEALVALVDYRMPQMDGYTMLRAVTDGGAELRRHAYVLVTANRAHLPPAFTHLLASYHIPIVDKPFDLDTMLTMIGAARDQLVQTNEQQVPGG
jgi:CheY-like chemotaxis protein